MMMDIVCVDSNNQPTMSGHMEMIFDSREQLHGTVTAKGTRPGQPGRPGMPLDMQTKVTAHFLSVSCGDLQPGESKVMSSQ